MTPTSITSRVGADGVLAIELPLGPAEANREVRVTVVPLAPNSDMSEQDWAEWRAWVKAMAGQWQGEFERPPQDDYEERDSLS